MTTFPRAIAADERLVRARDMMEENHVRYLPVTRAGRLASVISAVEVERALESRQGQAAGLKVGDACAHDAYTVDVATPLDEVLVEMARRHIDCALVVKEGRLAGIFTAIDACRALADLLREIFPVAGGGDAA